MRTFAIKIGKYVEFRTNNRPPQVKVSRLTKVVETIRERLTITDDYPYYAYVKEPAKVKRILKMMCPIGGRVLGVVKYSKYSRYSRFADTIGTTQQKAPKFGKQTVIEIPKTVATILLSRSRL